MEGQRRQRGTSERVEESGRSSDDGDQRWSHEVALVRWEEVVTCVAKRLRVLGKLLAMVLGERGVKGEGWIVRGAEGGCAAESGTAEDKREESRSDNEYLLSTYYLPDTPVDVSAAN